MWLLVGIGCASPEELKALEVCDAFCTCLAPLPGANDRCNDECIADLGPQPISDACLTCTQEASCSQVNDCFDICFQAFPEGNP